jgi:hypothetical protein
MIHFQVQATLANGATVMFGTKADSGEGARDTALERLAETGQLAADLTVDPLVPASER